MNINKHDKQFGEKFLAKLYSQPGYWEQELEKMPPERRAIVEQNLRDAAPLTAALREMGFQVHSPDELRVLRLDYRNAIPLLMEWLPKMDNLDIKWSIISCLSVKWAKPDAAPLFIEEFRKLPSQVDPEGIGIRWSIASGLSTVATDAEYEDIVELLEDKSNRGSRQMLALSLAKMKDPQAVDVLLNLLDDDEVCGHAVVALGKLKAEKARSAIEPFLNHEKTWIRNEAKKAIQRIDKEITKKAERKKKQAQKSSSD